MSNLLNIKSKDVADVYIGRGSIFGNPFIIGVHGDRESVIAQYKKYMWRRIASDKRFDRALRSLHGKSLGCYCAPKKCHGNVILDYLNWLETKGDL